MQLLPLSRSVGYTFGVQLDKDEKRCSNLETLKTQDMPTCLRLKVTVHEALS